MRSRTTNTRTDERTKLESSNEREIVEEVQKFVWVSIDTSRKDMTGQRRAEVDGIGRNKIRRWWTEKRRRRDRRRNRIGWDTTGQMRKGLEEDVVPNRRTGDITASVKVK
jgi:hypothetical protein